MIKDTDLFFFLRNRTMSSLRWKQANKQTTTTKTTFFSSILSFICSWHLWHSVWQRSDTALFSKSTSEARVLIKKKKNHFLSQLSDYLIFQHKRMTVWFLYIVLECIITHKSVCLYMEFWQTKSEYYYGSYLDTLLFPFSQCIPVWNVYSPQFG